MTRNDLHDLFGRHRSSKEIGDALRILVERGLVECEKENTSGRPVERWFSTSEGARKARKARKGEGCVWQLYLAHFGSLIWPTPVGLGLRSEFCF